MQSRISSPRLTSLIAAGQLDFGVCGLQAIPIVAAHAYPTIYWDETMAETEAPRQAVIEGNAAKVKELTQQALDAGDGPQDRN